MRKMLLALILMAAPALAGTARDMAPETVREALEWGAAQKDAPAGRLRGRESGAVSFTTPFLRVASLAFEAKRDYRSLSTADVPSDVLAPVLEISARPWVIQTTIATNARVKSVRRIVVTGPKGSAPIQPTTEEPLAQTFGNEMGANWQGRGLVAQFPLDVLRPDAEVHVLYDDGDDVTYRFDLRDVR